MHPKIRLLRLTMALTLLSLTRLYILEVRSFRNAVAWGQSSAEDIRKEEGDRAVILQKLTEVPRHCVMAQPITFGNWIVGCDNGLACTASALKPYREVATALSFLMIKIERGANGSDPARLVANIDSLRDKNENLPNQNIILAIDSKPLPGKLLFNETENGYVATIDTN